MPTNKLAKNPGGRPPAITEEVEQKLESVLRLDVSDKVACEYAGISRDTYYRTLKDNQEFSDRMTTAKNYARIAAGQVVVQAIVKDKDVASAKWWLEKRHGKEFSSNPEIVFEDNRQVNLSVNHEQVAKRLYRLLQKSDL